ncbi:BTAD domain-containing putative transcriptional regulator [Plantactinospora siamensis]|uniref:BTAD domain-containing putative transcriptional regulator n=1 Tax=Plantactinospora siamensis TaxID=555372 RepID=A0ABV6NWQ5_9ACTN
MRFQVLGPLQVTVDELDLTPTAPKPRQVLALLVMRCNEVVRLSELITELWGEDPPPSALPTVQTYIYKLRKALRGHGVALPDPLLTRPYGYQLVIPEESVDARRFIRLAAAGQAAFEQADHATASQKLGEALALWRGAALADVSAGELLSARATGLEESRLDALRLRIRADLELGRHHTLISELKALTAQHPLNEEFHAQLMLALHRANRRSEALATYQHLRAVLHTELGTEPSVSLRELHRTLLTSEASAPPAPGVRGGGATATRTSPAQLPASPPYFSGRRALVKRLSEALLAPPQRTTGRLVTLTGMPGVGKTALAVRVAHDVRSRFADGQLYLDLGGSTAHPVPVPEALATLLGSLGITGDRLPESIDERSALFRTLVARRRVLLILDDAPSATLIGPLLPGSASCAVLVTTRGHPRPGADRMQVPLLAAQEGIELLELMVGRDRVRRELAAAHEIVGRCGGLPLAMYAAGVRLAARPERPLADLAARLRDPETQLEELRVSNCDVPARYEISYQRLQEWERSAFRLLSLIRQGNFGVAEVSGLLGCEPGDARLLLERLAEQHLLRVEWHEPRRDVRYGFHRLVRAFARQRLETALRAEADPAPAGRLAKRRLAM